MRLGINGWRLRTKTGVARVLLNMLRHWSPEVIAGRFEKVTVYSPVDLATDLPIPEFFERRVVGPDLPMLAWENTSLVAASRDDVLLCPSYSRPILTGARTVTLIYEATQKLFPEYYPLAARFVHTPLYGWSARNSTIVVTNTEQAREDICSAYHALPDKVRVVPLAPAEIFAAAYDAQRIEDVRAKYASGAPYFLYVGKLTARRNVPHIVEGLAKLKQAAGGRHKAVIVGLNTTGVDLEGLSASLGVSGDVLHYQFVPDEDLAPLYCGAEAFVLPYSYESAASLTLLEAQSAGAPVITTDTPGLRQVAGGAALFLPNAGADAIAAAMGEITSNAALRDDLIRRGRENAAHYSWRRCSHELLDILYEAGAK